MNSNFTLMDQYITIGATSRDVAFLVTMVGFTGANAVTEDAKITSRKEKTRNISKRTNIYKYKFLVVSNDTQSLHDQANGKRILL